MVTLQNYLLNEHFDIIVSFETIEHIIEYKKFLNECSRVLKKGGTIVCSTPNKKFSSSFLKKQLNPFHVIEFYPEEFQNLMNDYFQNIKLYGQFNVNIFKRIYYNGRYINFNCSSWLLSR